jgi:hypothetical protein
MQRQYHTPTGTYMTEPSQQELDMEWEMRKKSPDYRMQILTIAELTGKDEKIVEETMKKNWITVMKE